MLRNKREGELMAEDILLTEKIGRVLRLTLNRPHKLNAVNADLEHRLFEALDHADYDADTSVVIIRGNGRAFCAGHDLTGGGIAPDFDSTPQSPQADIRKVKSGAGRLAETFYLSIPVIAQLHGFCMGVGTCLALNCDLVVAASDTKIGFPPVRWGGSPPTHMWTYLMGPQWAKYMLLSGDTIDAPLACEKGLIFRTVAPEELDSAVLELATRLARTPRDLLSTNKGICNKALDLMGRTTVQSLAVEADVIGHFSPDARTFFKLARESSMRAALDWQEKVFGK